jgi:hypothetical protein
MDAPVTRRELREELANYATRRELHEALDTWAGAIIDKITTQVTTQVTAQVTAQVTVAMDARFAEMRALIKTTETALIMRMDALLDPHHGVPERVSKLEAEELPARVRKLESKVFAPKRRTAKRAR